MPDIEGIVMHDSVSLQMLQGLGGAAAVGGNAFICKREF